MKNLLVKTLAILCILAVVAPFASAQWHHHRHHWRHHHHRGVTVVVHNGHGHWVYRNHARVWVKF